jgi:predicted nuclease of restriction endonuclease-like (RecB) superfamily
MSERPQKPATPKTRLPTDYATLLADIKARVQTARIKAGLAANRELLALYWQVGRLILDRQRKEGWGAKVIDRLSADLQREFPGQQGFSPRNLKYMRAFAEAWPESAIVQRSIARRAEAKKSQPAIVQAPPAQAAEPVAAIVQRPVAQLPWRHHTILLDRLSTAEIRLWYASKAVEHGWSGDVLALQIEAGLHKRQGKACDQPSIGLILCRSNNRVIAEYALRDMTKPIGVSGYVTKLVDSLPKALKGVVPSVAELEKGLAKE